MTMLPNGRNKWIRVHTALPRLTLFHSISHIKYLLKGTEIITLFPEKQ